MFALLMSLPLVYMVAGQSPKCCAPNQWEGYIFTMAGYINEGDTHLAKTSSNISYDATTKMIATESDAMVDEKPVHVRTIQDFNARTEYTIQDNMCQKKALGEWTSPCIPATALPLFSSYMGLTAGFMTEWYLMQVDELEEYVAVRKSQSNPMQCVPVLATADGSKEGMPILSTTVYEGITVGIRNMSVFTVPSICNSAPMEHTAAPKRSIFGI